jgi:signal transduction histidine kinase/CheY-like chemotaxis protein
MQPSALERARAFGREHGVIIIAMAACAMIVIGFASLMIYAGLTMRQIALERDTQLVHHAINRKMARVLQDVTSAAIWTEAYDKSVAQTDVAWLDGNLGQYYHQYQQHDLTLAFDARDRPFYASLKGAMVPPERLAAVSRAAAPLLAQVRVREAGKIASNPAALGFARAASAGAMLRVDGHIYAVQAATIVPEPGYKGLLRPRDPIVLSAVEIGPAFLTSLTDDYGVQGTHFAPPAPGKPGSVDLAGPDGEPILAIAWTPDKPGYRALIRARWTILAVTVMIVALLTLLVRGMARLVLQLRKAREDAFAASRAKSEFLANISHEIRTPLNGVLGMAQAMSADTLTPAQRERLAVIQESGSTLLALLNDVLDISKIQAGKLEVRLETFDLHDLCRDVCATFRPLAAAKEVQLDFAIETGGLRYWRGDAMRIRQVLSNLISNAVKFTEQGSVRLLAASTAGGLAFSVTDTGIGIDAEQTSRLFQKFSQADASTTRRHGGSGLGLAICDELVRLMRGSLRVRSVVGEGSEFAFVLPLESRSTLPPAEADGARPDNAAQAPGRALRILVAEDNLTNQLVLRALLEPLDVDLDVVANGAEAVVAFQEGAYDLVLMDVQMPVMSGVEASLAIRRIEAGTDRAHTPIIALSANVMTHHLAEYRAAGMDTHIAKPIEIEKLYALLQQVAARAPLEFQLAG